MLQNRSTTIYLIASARRGYAYDLKVRLGQRKPSLAAGEVAIKVELVLPSALFEKPTLEAKVIVPQSAVTPTTLPATVLDNVKEVLQQQTGMEIRVSVVEPTQVEQGEGEGD